MVSMKKHVLRSSVALFLAIAVFACAQEARPGIELLKQEAGDSYISLPKVSGLADPAVEAALNAAIYDDGHFAELERNLSSAAQSASGLKVAAEYEVIESADGEGLLSVLISASGKIGPGRPGYRAIPLVYSLETGRRIMADDLFLDRETAQAALDELTAENIEPAVSDYLRPENLYPVPIDSFLIDESGLSFYYAQEDYATLSNRSGAVNFHWDEIEGLLKREEGSVLASLRLSDRAEKAGEMIRGAALAGRLPGIPVRLGESMEEVLERYPLLFDAEIFDKAEKYQMEDARFRQTAVLAGNGEVSGLISTRMNLWGLLTERSLRTQALAFLGQPDSSIRLDKAGAEEIGLSPGVIDSFMAGNHELRLHFDMQDVLKTVWLLKSENER